jgi:rod shape-determining protein MreC
MLSFLKRNKPIVASCLFMIVSLHVLSLSTREVPRADLLRIAFQEILYPFQHALHRAVSGMRSLADHYVLLYRARKELDLARDQLEKMSMENTRLQEAAISYERLRDLLALQESLETKGIAAEVIARDAGSLFRSIVVNRGSRQGVTKGMVVVSPVGTVGHIFAVSPDSSRVLLISDPHSGLDAVVQRSRARGLVQGNLDGFIMKYVRREDDVQIGDQIVSSGADGLFPKGLTVGTVSRVIKRNQGMFQGVEVIPKVNFSQLEEVLILPAPTTG